MPSRAFSRHRFSTLVASVLVTAWASMTVASASVPEAGPTKAFLAADPEIRLFASTEDLPELEAVDERRVVREMYDRAFRVLREVGYAAEVEVSGFRTLYPEDFGTSRLAELISLPDSESIHVAIRRTDLVGATSPLPLVRVDAKWSDRYAEVGERLRANGEATSSTFRENLDRARPVWQEVARLRKSETRRFATQADPVGWSEGDFSRVRALTSFDVKLRFEGVEKEYRAAVVWQRRDDGTAAMVLQDHGIDRIDTLATLDTPSIRLSSREESDRARLEKLFGPSSNADALGSGLGEAKSGTAKKCLVKVRELKNDFNPKYEEANDGHTNGNHSISYEWGFYGSCTETCLATCIPESEGVCKDFGIVTGGNIWHKESEDGNEIGNVENKDKAACGFAYQCLVKKCVNNTCPGDTASAQVLLDEKGEIKFEVSQAPGAFWEDRVTTQALYHCTPCKDNQKSSLQTAEERRHQRLVRPPVIAPTRPTTSSASMP